MSDSITQPDSGETTARPHVAFLDGMRALAALFVVLHHCMLQVNLDKVSVSPGLSKIVQVLLLGHDSVDVFIVLSGFCLAMPVVRGDGFVSGGALNFFKKRARRILPPYYFALALSLLLIKFAI